MRRTSFLLVCAVSYQRVGIRFPSCAKLTQNLPLALELCWLIKFGPEAGLAARSRSCQKGLSPSGSPPSPFFQPWRIIRKTQVVERSFGAQPLCQSHPKNMSICLKSTPWKNPSCSSARTWSCPGSWEGQPSSSIQLTLKAHSLEFAALATTVWQT